MKEITFPTGRLVWGSLYEPVTTDMDGTPLVYKSGAKKGQPRSMIRFGYAIAKTPGLQPAATVAPALAAQGHTLQTLLAQPGWTLQILQQQGHVTMLPAWAAEPWGKDMYDEAAAHFRNGEILRPDFSWKITDGDSAIPGKAYKGRPGRAPKDKEGHPGHWVLTFSSDFAANIYTQDATGRWVPNSTAGLVKCGHYIQVSGNTDHNEGQSPGLYLNHNMVAYRGWGQEIVAARDPNAAGFGLDALPAGASVIPQGTPALPVAAPGVPALPPLSQPVGAAVPSLPSPVAPAPAAITSPSSLPPPTAVTPHTAILTLPPVPGVPGAAPPPPPPPAGPQMTPAAKAAGYTFEALLKAGWTEAQMRAAGHLI